MSNYHVTKSKDGGWNVKKEGGTRASGNYDTKNEAERCAKNFSRNSGGGEVKIHNKENRIIDSDTVKPGNDPNPPKDSRH